MKKGNEDSRKTKLRRKLILINLSLKKGSIAPNAPYGNLCKQYILIVGLVIA